MNNTFQPDSKALEERKAKLFSDALAYQEMLKAKLEQERALLEDKLRQELQRLEASIAENTATLQLLKEMG